MHEIEQENLPNVHQRSRHAGAIAERAGGPEPHAHRAYRRGAHLAGHGHAGAASRGAGPAEAGPDGAAGRDAGAHGRGEPGPAADGAGAQDGLSAGQPASLSTGGRGAAQAAACRGATPADHAADAARGAADRRNRRSDQPAFGARRGGVRLAAEGHAGGGPVPGPRRRAERGVREDRRTHRLGAQPLRGQPRPSQPLDFDVAGTSELLQTLERKSPPRLR